MSTGWQTLSKPKGKAPTEAKPTVTPEFLRLARVQALSAAGDAAIAVALAGTLFFSIDPDEARYKVGLYLAFTVAPFAIVGPLIGPALDRAKGGRRMMMILINLVRSIAALFLIGNMDSLLLLPFAFMLMVFGKAFAVGKAALVPTAVRHQGELVTINSKLALISGLAGVVGAAPAAVAGLIFGPGGSVALAMILFAGAATMSTQLPRTAVAPEPADSTEKLELKSSGIIGAAQAMGLLRGVVGYMTFLLAFAFSGGERALDHGAAFGRALRDAFGLDLESLGGTPAWKLGVVVGGSVLGSLLGSVVAPRMRKRVAEERMLAGVLVLLAAIGVLCAWVGGLSAAALLAMTVGFAAGSGKLAFDSIVQRDAPDANYGRSFARFETRFQICWVLGALLPVVLPTPLWVGFLVVACVAGFAAFTYAILGQWPTRKPAPPKPKLTGDGDIALVEEDLRASYPKMNLRSPIRNPTGWETPVPEPQDMTESALPMNDDLTIVDRIVPSDTD